MILAACDRLYSSSSLVSGNDSQNLAVSNSPQIDSNSPSFAYSLTYALLTQGTGLRLPSGNASCLVPSKLLSLCSYLHCTLCCSVQCNLLLDSRALLGRWHILILTRSQWAAETNVPLTTDFDAFSCLLRLRQHDRKQCHTRLCSSLTGRSLSLDRVPFGCSVLVSVDYFMLSCFVYSALHWSCSVTTKWRLTVSLDDARRRSE